MAARFWVGGGSSSNWSATIPTNWAATTGGVNNQTVPGASDTVTFDGAGASGNTASTVSATITVLSLTFSSGYTQSVTLNAVLTVAGNFTDNTAHSWAGASGLTISAASTIASGGKTFPNAVSFSGANTKTLNGNWTISGALTISTASTIINWTTNETLSCAGLIMSGATTSGTAKIILTGGTWSGNNALINDLDIAGTVTISGAVAFNTKTLTWVSGTITTTGSTLNIAASTTLNTAGITWNNITLSATATLTLNSLLTSTGTFLCQTGVVLTFAGTSAFTLGTLTIQNSASTSHTLVHGLIYTITTAFNCFLSRTNSIVLWQSDSAGSQAKVQLQWGATCNVVSSFTDIDASSGQPITTVNGVLSNTKGIIAQTNNPSIAWNAPIQMVNLPVTSLHRNRRFQIRH